MAQTKQQKQLKALKYWIARLESPYIQKYHKKDLLYIQNQISCLTEKLKDEPGITTCKCPLCATRFIQLFPEQLICSLCKEGFYNVTMYITAFAEVMVDAGSKAAASLLDFGEAFRNIQP